MADIDIAFQPRMWDGRWSPVMMYVWAPGDRLGGLELFG